MTEWLYRLVWWWSLGACGGWGVLLARVLADPATPPPCGVVGAGVAVNAGYLYMLARVIRADEAEGIGVILGLASSLCLNGGLAVMLAALGGAVW